MEYLIYLYKPIIYIATIIWGISILVRLLRIPKQQKPPKPPEQRITIAGPTRWPTPVSRGQAIFEASQYARATGHSYAEINSDDGLLGEYLLSKHIEKALPTYSLLFSLYVPTKRNRTSEVDIVLVHETGIYVFESKYYAGWIFGSDGNRRWTQTFKTTKNQFPNPVMQNEGHIRALQAYLGLPRSTFLSVIVFGDNCEFKKINVNSTPVLQMKQVTSFMLGTVASRRAIMQPAQCQEAFTKLEALSHASEETKEAHIKQLQDRYGGQ